MSTVRVEGLRELNRALAKGDKAMKKEVRDRLRTSGDIVRVAAAAKFSRVDARSASGFKTRVRQRGIAVEQSRKNSGGSKRSNYAGMQMAVALYPALEENEKEVIREFEQALDDVAHIIERG